MAVTVGKDEFCLFCMEWRECDENGRCTVCGRLVKKKELYPRKVPYDEYGIEDASYETDEEIDESEVE